MSDVSLGIDIGSHAVKAVLLKRRSGRIQVVRAGSAPLEELGHLEDSRRKVSKVAMIVRNLLRSMGVRSVPARIAVSGKKSIIRYTRVPPAPAWRLKMLIDYEIEGDTESGGKDLAYDFRLLDLPTSHLELTVMIAMARNELVESACDILDEAGVAIDNVTLTPFPLFNTFAHNRGAADDDKTYLLVDIGAENLNVVVQQNGKLFFARNIAPGGRAFTEAVQDEFRLPFAEAERLKCTKGRLFAGGEARSEDETQASPSADADDVVELAEDGDETQVSPSADAPAEISGREPVPPVSDDLEVELSPTDAGQVSQLAEAMLPVAGRLASAIQSTLMYCRAQTRMPDMQVDKVVLTGGGSMLPGIRQVLSRRLGIPVIPADPLKGFDLTPLRRDAREALEREPDTYTTALGLALSGLKPDAVDLSLLPRRVKERRHFLERTVYLWLAGAALLASLGIVAYSSWRSTSRLDNYTGRLDNRLSANQHAKSQMEMQMLVNKGYAQEIRQMETCLVGPRELAAAFGALTAHVPPEVMLTRFTATGTDDPAGSPEVIIGGYVLKKVKQRGGTERIVQSADAHDIIGKLANDLKRGPAFGPPPGDQPVIQRQLLEPAGSNAVATFQLKLCLARAKP